jgi:DNA replication factor GINS
MDLDELQSVQSRERQTDSLQQLRESFYAEAGEFIQQLRDEREQAAARAEDPFDAPTVNRLTDDINTAEQTVEAIYERRVGKIVKMASLAAADMPVEDEGLTDEERDLFDRLVTTIDDNRARVMDVLDGESPVAPTASNEPSPTPQSEPTAGEQPRDTTAEAAAIAGQPEEAAAGERPSTDGGVATEPVAAADVMGASSATAGDADDATGGQANGDAEDSDPAVDRTEVVVTADVGEIFGVDQREYDLSTGDVVSLPAANADPLIEQDAARRID